jgi:hypothetical protein
MKLELQIDELEHAINRFKRARPFTDYVLPVDLRLMASLYGKMIHFRLPCCDLALETIPTQVVVQYWRESGAPLGANGEYPIL